MYVSNKSNRCGSYSFKKMRKKDKSSFIFKLFSYQALPSQILQKTTHCTLPTVLFVVSFISFQTLHLGQRFMESTTSTTECGVNVFCGCVSMSKRSDLCKSNQINLYLYVLCLYSATISSGKGKFSFI